MAPLADDSVRTRDDLTLEAAYRAELATDPTPPDAVLTVAGVPRRAGDLRALCVADLADRVTNHPLLRRADDTARVEALRFVERRLAEGDKIAQYSAEGAFQGFLRRVLSNLLLDWLRSPAAKAELRRAEHDPGVGGEVVEPELPREEAERNRRLGLHHLVAIRTLQTLPPGRGIPLMLALWPAYEHTDADRAAITGFAHCHETADGQAGARACDAGKRCGTPSPAYREAHAEELARAKAEEPAGLSRKAIADVLRIGRDKPLAKREGAVCERISKGRLMLLEALRRSGIRGLS